MSLLVPGESVPASVTRHLLPNERRVITVRRHPVLLLWPVVQVLGGLVVAGVLTGLIQSGNSLLVNIVWWAWIVLLARFTVQVLDWWLEYIVLTSSRILWARGLLTRKLAMMPLAKVTDMSFQRSIPGRVLGYGQYIIESAGQDQALRTISYIPHPEAIYQEMMSMIFPGAADRAED